MTKCFIRKGLVSGIIVLLIGISIMHIAGGLYFEKNVSKMNPYDIDLFCNEPYKNVKKGDTAMFVIEITNTGNLDDTYNVITGSIEDIVCKVNGVNADQFNPYEFTLISSESTTFEVTAEVWESVPIGEWNIFIEARSQNNTEIYDELTLTVNVQKKTKVISYSKDDCNCNDDYINILEISEKYQKLLDFVKLDKSLNPSTSDNCIYLLMKFMNVYYLAIMYHMIGNLFYPQYRNLADKFYQLGDFYIWKAIETFSYANELGCKWNSWYKPDPPPDP